MSIRPTRFLTGLGALALLMSACAGAPDEGAAVAGSADLFPATASSCEFETTVTTAPERAVTMTQGATEVMLALGLEDRMAGTSQMDDEVAQQWREAYDSVPRITKDYPNREKILDVRADFVYGSYISAFEDEGAGSRESLADLGIASYLSPFSCGKDKALSKATFEMVWGEVSDVATLFGVPDRAESFVDEQKAQLADIEAQQAGRGLNVFWFDSGDKSAYTGAGAGGPQLVLDAVGATNLFADLKGSWADVAWEEIVSADPDVIVLADAEWSTAEEKRTLMENDPVLKDMRAVKAGSFVVLPFSETTPGVRLLQGAERVSDQLKKLDLPAT